MPRMGRVVLPNYPHHVVQRGHNRQVVFAGTEGFQRYLSDLHELKDVFGVKLYAYCLMTNHVPACKTVGERFLFRILLNSMEELLMKKMVASILGFAGALVAFSSIAGVLPKDVIHIKEGFDKVGAKNCSKALAETVNFISKGRPVSSNRQWSTSDTNKNPISLQFMAGGTKSEYSLTGSIVLMPVGDKCIGSYTYSYVAPTGSCKTYIQKEGFDGAEWQQDLTEQNGDGGSVYFMSVKTMPTLGFVFNDVAGGCSLTKRETLFLDASK